MAKTSRDARRHIQALSKFFSTGGVSRAEMEHILKESKKRKYLKQSVRRLIERGFIVSDGENFSSTPRGSLFFRRFCKSKNPKPKVLKQWDGKWRLITFDVPCHSNYRRNAIRLLLKEFNFYQLQKSVWICPNALSSDFWKIVVNSDLEQYCKTMIVDFIENDGKIKQHFRIAV